MPKELGNKNNIHLPNNTQMQFLENKVNNLRRRNDVLNREVFDAVQRGHRLAAKLGYKDLDEAEFALATQAGQDVDVAQSQKQQSQHDQLSQRPADELASHVQALQSELVSHVHLSRATLSALDDAVTEMATMREENECLRRRVEEKEKKKRGGKTRRRKNGEDESMLPAVLDDLKYTRAELTSLKEKYRDLHKAKEEAEIKHSEDYEKWKVFKAFIMEKMGAKRRKLNPEASGDGKETHTRESSLASSSSATKVLTSVSLNGSPVIPTPSQICCANGVLPKLPTRSFSIDIPSPSTSDEYAASSETEPDSQPVKFLYPSQQDVKKIPSMVPQERSHSSAPDSSETEFESQAPMFLFDSQIIPLTPAQVTNMTPSIRPVVRNTQQQLMTPVSVARPSQWKENEKDSSSSAMVAPVSSPLRAVPFPRPTRPLGPRKARLPETPVSHPPKKGKGKDAVENDENTPVGTSASAKSSEKKYPADYSIYKGRGRYGAVAQPGKETINALFEINPEHNEGVAYQYDEVVRDKGRRKQMHGADCECCRDYYSAVGPLPNRLQRPMWRSPQSSPSKKRKLDSFEDDDEDDNNRQGIGEHMNAISRHRQHWARGSTPPRYWDIGFPDTQQVADMNAEATRMHERKRAIVADEAERGGKYRRR